MDFIPTEVSKISLREYVPEDRGAAVELFWAGFFDSINRENRALCEKLEEYCHSNQHYYDDIPGYVCKHNGGKFMVAVDENNTVVGTGGLVVNDDDFKERKGELVRLFVRKEHRGKKIGKLLYNYAINYAKNKLNLSSLYLRTLDVLGPAVGMYTKYGYKEVSRRPFSTEAFQLTMELSLIPTKHQPTHSTVGRIKYLMKKTLKKCLRNKSGS